MKKRKGRSFQHPQNKIVLSNAAGIEEISFKTMRIFEKIYLKI